jgi:hypothetical protein
MGRIDNLKGDSSQELRRAMHNLRMAATTNALDSGSVHNGRTRYSGDSSLIIEGTDALRITGGGTVTGILRVIGSLLVSGFHGITGTLNVSGPWNLSGTGGITGDVSSTGAWTQSGTMTLTGAGRIQSSSVVMDAAGLSSPFILNLVTPTVLVSQAIAINGNLTANGQTQLNQLKVTSLPIASGTVYTVMADASGNLYRKSVAG